MEKLTISDCAVRAWSKKEVYSLLVVQGNLFLPPIEEWNHEFIKQIVQGKKIVNLFNIIPSLVYKGMRRKGKTSTHDQRNTVFDVVQSPSPLSSPPVSLTKSRSLAISFLKKIFKENFSIRNYFKKDFLNFSFY